MRHVKSVKCSRTQPPEALNHLQLSPQPLVLLIQLGLLLLHGRDLVILAHAEDLVLFPESFILRSILQIHRARGLETGPDHPGSSAEGAAQEPRFGLDLHRDLTGFPSLTPVSILDHLPRTHQRGCSAHGGSLCKESSTLSDAHGCSCAMTERTGGGRGGD